MSARKLLKGIRDAWFILGLSLALFLVLDGVLGLVFMVRDHFHPPTPAVERRFTADSYRGAEWANAYAREFADSNKVRWEPYVYWRRKTYHGSYINVEDNGIRQTPAPKLDRPRSAPSLRIFMFGGSTMWGTGARDAGTIPSLVWRDLRKIEDGGVDVEVINFGETGYVSTQEVVALMLELHKGNVPSVVVFYDGANDAFSTYQQGRAGIPQNEANRAGEFNLTNPENMTPLKVMAMRDAVESTAVMRAAHGLLYHLGVQNYYAAPGAPRFAWIRRSNADEQRLANDTVRLYVNNMKQVRALAAAYHFKYLFYWQPTLFDKPNPTDYERTEYDTNEPVRSFYEKVYDAVDRLAAGDEAGDHFHNLRTIFADLKEPVFIDWMHLSEQGNGLIAKKMSDDMVGILPPEDAATQPGR